MAQSPSQFSDEELLRLAQDPAANPQNFSETERTRLRALMGSPEPRDTGTPQPPQPRSMLERVRHPTLAPKLGAALSQVQPPFQPPADWRELVALGLVAPAVSADISRVVYPVGRMALTAANRMATKAATAPLPELGQKLGTAAGMAYGLLSGGSLASSGGAGFGGAQAGRVLGGAARLGARGLEVLTGGRAVPPVSATELDELAQKGYPPALIEKITAALKAGAGSARQGSGVAPMTDEAYQAATGGPRGSLSLQALRQAPSSATVAPRASVGASQALSDLFGGDRTTGSFEAGPGGLRDVPRMLAETRGTAPIDPIAKALGLPPGSRVLQMKPAGLQALAREKGAAEATTLLNRTGQLPEAWQRLLPAEQRNALAGLRGGPRGGLPLEAQREIDQALAGLSAAEAKAYLMKAPNPAAYNYILHKIRGE